MENIALYWEVATHEDAIEALHEKIQAMQADRHAKQWQAVGVRRKTLFSRAQAEFYDRKDRFSSDESPNRQDQIAFCHPSKVDSKMVQEEVRQAAVDYASIRVIVTEEQRN